jgi:hypothetical protein
MDGGDAAALSDPMANHVDTREALLSLFSLRDFTDEERKQRKPEQYILGVFGTTGPAKINQGNKPMARHNISKAQCLSGLRGVVLQTEEQRAICGADYMVPIYEGGKKDTAKFCIDIFEFPNKPCELPMVWTAPSIASVVCNYQGKRLCAQEEWNLACRADPNGGPDTAYAYGDDLDLDICNTNKTQHPNGAPRTCSVRDAQTAWNTCNTETEPVGSFPRCRSRFGVFDQHGNIAEVMTRKDPQLGLVDQLKGSAWFYVDVMRDPKKPPPADTKGTYIDTCNFDPRWHVEPMNRAMHVNYHLGFRCCKSITP